MKAPLIRMTREPVDVAAARRHVDDPAHGAAAIFEGVVRNRARDRDVRWLEYEAYPEMAEKIFARIAAHMAATWGPLECAIWHRYGRIEIGEIAVVVAVSSPHRAQAFDACRYAIDTIKHEAPIWKKELYADGAEWIGPAAES